MENYVMDIKDEFIPLIENGIKRLDYRLNFDERDKISQGDRITYISSENKGKAINVIVRDVVFYNTWSEALNGEWKKNFGDRFDSKEKVEKESNLFCSLHKIEFNGVIVYKVEKERILFRKSNVLLDTNVILERAFSRNGFQESDTLFDWFSKLKMSILIHPKTINGLDNNPEGKKGIEICVKDTKYKEVNFIGYDSDIGFKKSLKKYYKEENEEYYGSILYSVYCGVADFLITEDKNTLEIAKELHIEKRVLTISGAIEILEQEFPKLVSYKILAIHLEKFESINIKSDFFDSLREDYPGFDEWFHRKKDEKAYVFRKDNVIHGFLYLKTEYRDEDYSDIVPTFEPRKRLKIGTFKLDEEIKGCRLGERFLKIIFDNAKKQGVEEIYVTLFKDKRKGVQALKNLFKKWGFIEHGHKKSNGELVLVKDFTMFDSKKSIMENFPNVPKDYNMYFLPIKPEYHTSLFPDSILNNENIKLYNDLKSNYYALEKIYVCSAFDVDKVNPGDIIVIYRNGDRYPKKYSSACTGLAVMEQIKHFDILKDYLNFCNNRTIFSEAQLTAFFNNNKYRTVIKMIYLRPFDDKIILKILQDNSIVKNNSGPRPLNEIPNEFYKRFMKHK